MNRRHLLLLGLALLSSACNRWRPNTPRRLRFRDPVKAFEAARAMFKQLGYRIVRDEPKTYHLEVLAKLDQPHRLKSYIAIQVYADGLMIIRVHGDHVKEDMRSMHRKLATEVDRVINALRAAGP